MPGYTSRGVHARVYAMVSMLGVYHGGYARGAPWWVYLRVKGVPQGVKGVLQGVKEACFIGDSLRVGPPATRSGA